jgi:hypothetical protein
MQELRFLILKEIIVHTTISLICLDVLQFGCAAQLFERFVRPAQ